MGEKSHDRLALLVFAEYFDNDFLSRTGFIPRSKTRRRDDLWHIYIVPGSHTGVLKKSMTVFVKAVNPLVWFACVASD